MLCYNEYYAAYAHIQSILQTATITIRTYYYIRNQRQAVWQLRLQGLPCSC